MKRVPVFLFFLAACSLLFSQEVSEKQEIAVFKLGYYGWQVPPQAMGSIDQQILDVFINLGRFNVIGTTYRMEEGDIESFVTKIREYKAAATPLPGAVMLGHQAFTEADFNRLSGSFILVIPVLTNFEVKFNEEGRNYSSSLSTSFTLVNVEEGQSFAHFIVNTIGSGQSPPEAVKNAVDSIPIQLGYEIRKIPLFQIKTGIVDMQRNTAVIQFGSNLGVTVGDEFVIMDMVTLPSGIEMKKEAGLLIVKEVMDEYSFAYVLYADRGPYIGDQLYEVPRMGMETAIYAHVVPTETETAFMLGAREVFTRGFYKIRPFAGIELPLSTGNTASGLLGTAYLGAELSWYLRRIQIIPSAAVGLTFDIPFSEEEDFEITHAGGVLQVSINYLLNKNLKVFLDGGYCLWFAVDELHSSVMGPVIGGGVTMKY